MTDAQMTNKPKLLRFLCLCLVMSVFSMGYAQESGQKYAYQLPDPDGTTTIYQLDPVTLEITSYTTLRHEEEGYLSPNGEWFAYLSYNPDPEGADGFSLFNIFTRETIEVIADFKYPYEPHNLTFQSEHPFFAWSPNSRYFALHFESGVEQQSTYLYDIDKRILHDLGVKNVNQYHLAWSPDGEKLALLNIACSTWNCNPASIHIYTAATAQVEHIIDVKRYTGNNGQADVCNLEWSPTGEYLTFLENCDNTFTIIRRDLYLIHLESGEITPITDVMPPDLTGEDIFRSQIQSVWFDDVTIFFGLRVSHQELEYQNNQFIQTSPNTTYSYSLRYTATDQYSQLLDWRNLVNWSVGKDGRVGYLTRGEPIYLPDQVNPTIPYTMEIAHFDGQQLTPVASGPSGCYPQWNDAGQILSYYEDERRYSCEFSRGTAIIFLDENGMRRFPLEEGMHPLGWFTPSVP